MISKSDAVWLLKKAMEYGMTYTDGKYQHAKLVTMYDTGYRVIPVDGGTGFCIEEAYKCVFSFTGSPEDLKEVSDGI
jgi:hypothetical protein